MDHIGNRLVAAGENTGQVGGDHPVPFVDGQIGEQADV